MTEIPKPNMRMEKIQGHRFVPLCNTRLIIVIKQLNKQNKRQKNKPTQKQMKEGNNVNKQINLTL